MPGVAGVGLVSRAGLMSLMVGWPTDANGQGLWHQLQQIVAIIVAIVVVQITVVKVSIATIVVARVAVVGSKWL